MGVEGGENRYKTTRSVLALYCVPLRALGSSTHTAAKVLQFATRSCAVATRSLSIDKATQVIKQQRTLAHAHRRKSCCTQGPKAPLLDDPTLMHSFVHPVRANHRHVVPALTQKHPMAEGRIINTLPHQNQRELIEMQDRNTSAAADHKVDPRPTLLSSSAATVHAKLCTLDREGFMGS